MTSPTVSQLHARLAEERDRRVESERLLGLVAGAAAARPLRWVHRVTGRGPDLAAISRHLTQPAPEPLTVTDPEQIIVDEFHRLYYDHPARTWQNTFWLGTPTRKVPLDLWIYQELIAQIRPDTIVECGTRFGGSALYFANVCDLIGHGNVVSIDIEELPGRPVHPRIEYLIGSSIDDDVVSTVRGLVGGGSAMVILDSDHTEPHVLAELHAYSSLVSPDSYLVVEDTNIHGHPVLPDRPPGPAEAVARFLADRDDFVISDVGHKYYLTFNPGGWLKRVR